MKDYVVWHPDYAGWRTLFETRREALTWAEVERRNVPSGERFYTLSDREGRLARYRDGQRVYPNGMPSSAAPGVVVNGVFYPEVAK